MKKKLRKLSDITNDMEPLIRELTDVHELQVHEVLGLVYSYLIAHCPESIEEYTDGSNPVYYYGHRSYINK